MRNQVMKALSGGARDLWLELEKAHGGPIEIREMPLDAPQAANAGANPGPADPFLCLRQPIQRPALVHELLHLERYWLLQVPQLKGHTASSNNVAKILENPLEHLSVVPRQAFFEASEPDVWEEASLSVWRQHPWPSQTTTARRNTALLEWLSTCLCPGGEAERCGRAILTKMNLLVQAEKFKSDCLELLSDKKGLVRRVLEEFGMPANQFGLLQIDIGTRNGKLSPLE